jgi:amidophosphoribosyltransferase
LSLQVPDTARTAAIECASQLGIAYREGFIKNRYVGRTFIMPQQGLRKKSVRQKLAPIASEFVGRNVLLVDDSIVRGTTSMQIIAMVREAGAKRVYMASAAPPVKFPNVYGIDMPTKEELIASRHETDEAIAAELGADKVIFQVIFLPSTSFWFSFLFFFETSRPSSWSWCDIDVPTQARRNLRGLQSQRPAHPLSAPSKHITPTAV